MKKLETAFEKRCKKVSEKTGVDVIFFDDGKRAARDRAPFEDDGTLHIPWRGGQRACFDVSNGQNNDGEEQNCNTRAVLEAMGMARYVGDRVLVEEVDDRDRCPHCGEPL